MNKKIFGLAILILTLAMFVAPVIAMKGQTKQDFKLFFQGVPSADDVKIADGNTIRKDGVVTDLAEFYVQIGTGGATEDIAKEYLEYECDMDWIAHTKPEQFFNVHVVETISIYDSATTHDETTLRGTLVITAIGDNRGGHGGNFVGFGTGEFEGIIIEGVSEPLQLVFTNPNPPYYYAQLTRIGTVMGWPTP